MKTKKAHLLPLLFLVTALCMSIGIGGMVSAGAKATAVNKDDFASTYFTAVGDTYNDVDLSSYVKSISYGDFVADNFSGGGIMVETRNKAADLVDVTDNSNDTNPMLINFPSVKYSTGVKFNGVVDISDNTANDDTLIELAFPGTNDNWQCRGFKVIIEDAANPDKYITLFVWSPYGNTDATGGSMLAAAAASWEKTNTSTTAILIGEAGFDTDDYDGNGTARLMVVGNAIDTDGYGNSSPSDGEGCFINSKEHGHEKTSVNLSRTSDNSIKVQFNNDTGLLSINGVRVRNFSKFSAIVPSNNNAAVVKTYGSNVYDRFSSGKVKLSVGIVRTTRRSTDEYTRFCIMNIDGNSLLADGDDNITYNGLDLTAPSVADKDDVVANFTAVGDNGLDEYVNEISYGDFVADNFSGGGVMVKIRNKAEDLVDHTENSNDTNPVLVNFPGSKYTTGVKFNGAIDISDNTAYDTLIELAFPGENDNFQVRGFKVIIEDASNPDKYITLFIWNAYGNTDALDSGKSSIVGAAAGTWESEDPNDVSKTAFDTDDYNNDGVANDGCLNMCIGTDNVEASGKDICWINAGGPHGHRVTSIKFSRKSDNTIKVQFDNSTGILYVNGVRVRNFKDYSIDGEHYFDGFTNNKVTVSVGVVRSVRRSTDEFTKICVMTIDGNSLKADDNGNVYYYGYVGVPESGLIASGITEIPTPAYYGIDGSATPVESGVTVNITDPNGNKTEDYSAATFDFDTVGTYTIEYYVNGKSVGTANYTAAVKGEGDELSEIVSFTISDNLFVSKKISLADFTLTAGETVAIESATVKIYKGDELLATETADADWTYALTQKGELTFKVTGEWFSVKTTATVLPGIYPGAAIENGSVTINGVGEAVGLVVGTNDFVITPAHGYKLASLTVAGVDVTEEVENGEYTFNAENADENVTYTVVFEKLPDVTVTFKADGETIATVNGVENGTVFGDVTAPEIPEKEGYDATGWNLAADLVLTEDVIAEAVYTVKVYTITFDTNGGSQIAAKQYTALETVEAIDVVPVKTGYVFDAWYLDNEKYEFGGKLTANITLTAKYTVQKITVTVKSADFEDVVITIDYGTAVSAEDLGAKSGYEFKGLFTDEGLTVTYNGENITEDVILYASYSKKEGGCGAGIAGNGIGAMLIMLAAAVYFVNAKAKKVKEN